jgi:hypothetical protein
MPYFLFQAPVAKLLYREFGKKMRVMSRYTVLFCQVLHMIFIPVRSSNMFRLLLPAMLREPTSKEFTQSTYVGERYKHKNLFAAAGKIKVYIVKQDCTERV